MRADVAPEVAALIEAALVEDVGPGDWTTLWTVPEGRSVAARLIAKADGVLAGISVAETVFLTVDGTLAVHSTRTDGDTVRAGDLVMLVEGVARSVLMAERVALNFAQRLSGVASLARRYVEAVDGTAAVILDTRKTTPGMRGLEKAAVRAGGATNHRFGLYDMVLIKENHIAAAGGIPAAISAVRSQNATGLRVEIETTNPAEIEAAISAGVDRILFDNMGLEELREAVSLVRSASSKIETEASGGVSLQTVRAIAETGVDFISVGALTHSAPALDLSLLVDL